MMEQVDHRAAAIGAARKIIVKAGTRLLIDRASIAALVSGIAALRANGKQVLLVSSGAVGMGMEVVGMKTRPRELAQKQALAAIGQCKLMSIYGEEAERHGFKVAQMLLTAYDFSRRERCLNIKNCINALWEKDILPIINENDSVSVDELKFGDNDTLSAMMASITGAELTVILTTVDGLLDRNSDGSLGRRIPVVEKLDDDIRALAGGTDDGNFSIGGMASKLRAAEIACTAGAYLWIADGRTEDICRKILDGADVGTLFLPRRRLSGKKRWFGYLRKSYGTITVDDGAAEAVKHHGRSLLPSGALKAEGAFRRGDTVDIADRSGRVFARGLVNFDTDECKRIIGCKSGELHHVLGADADEELVHRDNLLLLL